MNEYEMADLFLTWGEFLEAILERYITVTFAFLVVAFLVSAKLQRPLVVIVLALYSYMALRYILYYINVASDSVALASQIRETRIQPDSSLAWLDISPVMEPILYTQAVAMFVAYLAALVFFFYVRHHPIRSLSSPGVETP